MGNTEPAIKVDPGVTAKVALPLPLVELVQNEAGTDELRAYAAQIPTTKPPGCGGGLGLGGGGLGGGLGGGGLGGGGLGGGSGGGLGGGGLA